VRACALSSSRILRERESIPLRGRRGDQITGLYPGTDSIFRLNIRVARIFGESVGLFQSRASARLGNAMESFSERDRDRKTEKEREREREREREVESIVRREKERTRSRAENRRRFRSLLIANLRVLRAETDRSERNDRRSRSKESTYRRQREGKTFREGETKWFHYGLCAMKAINFDD